jgi:hypothetical protein
MIELTKQELDNLRPISNKVLLKLMKKVGDKLIGFDAEKVVKTIDGEKVIHLDVTFEPEWMMDLKAEVVRNPTSLYFNDVSDRQGSMPWDTEIETMKGDVVHVEHFVIQQVFGIGQPVDYGNCFTCEGHIYILCDYSRIYIAIRDGQIIPLNGYVAGVHCKEEINTTLIVPDTVLGKEDQYLFQVIAAGTPNKAYRHQTYKAIRERDILVLPEYDFKFPIGGKKVYLRNVNLTIDLENEINPSLIPGLKQ